MQDEAGDSERRWKHLATTGEHQIKVVVMVIENGGASFIRGVLVWSDAAYYTWD